MFVCDVCTCIYIYIHHIHVRGWDSDGGVNADVFHLHKFVDNKFVDLKFLTSLGAGNAEFHLHHSNTTYSFAHVCNLHKFKFFNSRRASSYGVYGV